MAVILTQHCTKTLHLPYTVKNSAPVGYCDPVFFFLYITMRSLAQNPFSLLIFYPKQVIFNWVNLTQYCVGAVLTQHWVSFNTGCFKRWKKEFAIEQLSNRKLICNQMDNLSTIHLRSNVYCLWLLKCEYFLVFLQCYLKSAKYL